MSLAFSSQLAHFQIQRGIVGSIGEIGTYYGKYFFSISTAALPVEPKVAIDIFEDQTKNVDGSGSFVNSTRFREHAANLDVANLHILSQDSSTVTVSTLHARKLPPFRMFSVDGAHYKAATLRDLKLAYCSIRRDGVIVLDDWDNFEWTGVMDASYEFMHQVPDAAPFLYLCNKLYFTTRQHHALYFDFVLKNPCTPCSAVSLNNGDMHPSRYEIMGYKVCMVVSQDCAKWCGQ
ncbi:hypothetical protein HXX76_015783 [Chlamydomonas incerta]|uniref:Uncharacterized protein n=1 Tax=Chlamydomonas incerta TaxID=51695 RepID=A0A835SG36_CHLIN|nr:hypothetical protein HXX76_015783 [Chlamydomonas incerta]|eukprot:KAG2422763.1 hypothetical protein HXX76_015783 [Chlamydomonas incerta]